MAAPHAFQLTVVNCPSQVRVFLGASVSRREREREGERGRLSFFGLSVFSTMARLLFHFLFLSSASTSTPKKQKQNIKTGPRQDQPRVRLGRRPGDGLPLSGGQRMVREREKKKKRKTKKRRSYLSSFSSFFFSSLTLSKTQKLTSPPPPSSPLFLIFPSTQRPLHPVRPRGRAQLPGPQRSPAAQPPPLQRGHRDGRPVPPAAGRRLVRRRARPGRGRLRLAEAPGAQGHASRR